MRLYSLVIDNALDDPWALRDAAVAARYRDEPGPGGTTYPTISGDVPDPARRALATALAPSFGSVTVQRDLLRLTTAAARPPYWAHCDRWMGSEYTALLYLNTPAACSGGTAIVEHGRTGMRFGPENRYEEADWRRDTNDPDAWSIVTFVPMRFNRLFVLPSNLLHAASPGFGSTPVDGRLVFITFFSPRRA